MFVGLAPQVLHGEIYPLDQVALARCILSAFSFDWVLKNPQLLTTSASGTDLLVTCPFICNDSTNREFFIRVVVMINEQ